jgi:NADPH-dependent ferric siderophore reductase
MSAVKKLFADTLGKVLFRPVRVESAREVAPRFRRIELAGERLVGASFQAGDKVQVFLETGTRTYTPFSFDAARGMLSLLVYVHGSSPGAEWGKTVKAGDKALLFGPRGSLEFNVQGAPSIVVGDETSFALGRVLREQRSAAQVHLLFECQNPGDAECALSNLDVDGARLFPRTADDAHLSAIEEVVAEALARDRSHQLVLTGRSVAIQRLRHGLKQRGLLLVGQKSKAYWAPGKRGLD